MNVKNTIPEYKDEKQRELLIQKQYVRMQHIIYQRKLAQEQLKAKEQ